VLEPGEIVSYLEMCGDVGVSLQRGMNFRLRNSLRVILMSVRPGSPYADQIEDEGRTLIYEGHDIPKSLGGPDPKTVDQPFLTPSGRLTQNGQFFNAAMVYKKGSTTPELVRVFEKIRDGIWVYNGLFSLTDARLETSGGRKVFKFYLRLFDAPYRGFSPSNTSDIAHNRIIPSAVKVEVWKRDQGKCVKCGSTKNLHFDHDLPFSLGGASITASNIQLLCASCNLAKGNKIE
jgi:hypothetical protein